MKIIHSDLGWRATTAGSIVHLGKGRILWVNGGPDGLLICGRMFLRESFDNGETWSEPRMLLERETEDVPLSVALIRLRSGKLVHFVSLFGNYTPGASFDEAHCILHISFSDDHGKTWTKLKRVAEYVSLLRQQLGFLDSQLEALGVKSWDLQVKTLADLPIYKRPE